MINKYGGRLAIVICCLLLAGCSCHNQPGAAAELQVVANEQGYLFSEKGASILFFQTAVKSLNGNYARCNYVHPLYGLDGEILTEDFPEDHLHHHGIFWAWHQVWIGDQSIGDAWLSKDFRWEMCNSELLMSGKNSRTLKTETLWFSPLWTDSTGQEKPFAKEVTFIIVHAARDNYRLIDFEINLYALEPDMRIGGSNDEKGYGGFSPRFILPADTRFWSENGAVVPQNTALNAGPWVDVSGSFSNANVSGITILCHASNPGYPQAWILRQTRSMQNAVYPGRQPVPLPMEKPLTLRYRLVVHRGDAAAVPIQNLLQDYNRIKKFF